MDQKELGRVRAEETVHAMLEKIDKVLDEAKDARFLSHEDACTVKDCWKAIWYAKQCLKEE